MKRIAVSTFGLAITYALLLSNNVNGATIKAKGSQGRHCEPQSSRTLSARRNVVESFRDAISRYPSLADGNHEGELPYDVSVPLENLNLQEIPAIESLEALETQFLYTRDTRFMELSSDFPRRLSWLYPDDGCFVRSEIAAREIIASNFTAPKKVFAFGDLTAQTPNSPNGVVHWWYHVVPIFRIGDTAYVLDAAVNAKRSLTLDEWNLAIGGRDTEVTYAVCHTQTFAPDHDCFDPCPLTSEMTDTIQGFFLDLEWNRQLEMDRDPEETLGESPPWL